VFQGAPRFACPRYDLQPCVAPNNNFPFCNTSLTIDERVADLVSRIKVADYPDQFLNGASSIDYLGIPAYQWWDEATHGVGYSPGVNFSPPTSNATSFPEPILTASSFNTTLFNAIGGAVSDEASAFINVGHASYTYWAPNINLARDPR
jgi:beta-glucosidase-like glycosyl hydrolase